jgi:hypothetical protein
MLAELDAFFEDVAFSGGGFRDLFTSNVGFVNDALAPIYGLDPEAYASGATGTTPTSAWSTGSRASWTPTTRS